LTELLAYSLFCPFQLQKPHQKKAWK